VDDEFALWAKNPRNSRKFHVEVCWTEAISESLGISGPRYVVQARKTEALDSALSRIVELPFHVDFQIEAVACAPTPTTGACAEDVGSQADRPSAMTGDRPPK